jgi:hypothetical protein
VRWLCLLLLSLSLSAEVDRWASFDPIGVKQTGCTMTEYRDGDQYVGWHTDVWATYADDRKPFRMWWSAQLTYEKADKDCIVWRKEANRRIEIALGIKPGKKKK